MVYPGFPTLKAMFQKQAADLFQAQSPAIDPSLRWENQWRFEAIVAMGEIPVFFSLEPCVINKKIPYKPIQNDANGFIWLDELVGDWQLVKTSVKNE